MLTQTSSDYSPQLSGFIFQKILTLSTFTKNKLYSFLGMLAFVIECSTTKEETIQGLSYKFSNS